MQLLNLRIKMHNKKKREINQLLVLRVVTKLDLGNMIDIRVRVVMKLVDLGNMIDLRPIFTSIPFTSLA